MIGNEKVKIVYFINLRPGKWENILNEQLESLKKIKLYDISHEIYASVISDDNEIIKFRKLINDKYPKIKIKDVFKENVYEYAGVKTIYDISDENSIILY